MQNAVDTQIHIPVNYLPEYFDGLVLRNSPSRLDIVLQCVVRAIVSNHITIIGVVDDVVGFEHAWVVRELEGFNLVIQEIFGDFVGDVLELNHFDCHLSAVPDIEP